MSDRLRPAITIDEVTPAWLTELLRRHNCISTGSVVAVEKLATSAFNSHTTHLRPIYGPLNERERASAPTRLLLKCSLPAAWAQRAGMREVTFYRTVETLHDHPAVIPPCYDAIYDAEGGNSHLLLLDLSETHIVPVERDKQITLVDNLPSATHLHQAIDALARFHAYWWQSTHLGSGIAQVGAWCSDQAHFEVECARRREAWQALLAAEGDWLPPQIVTLYETLLNHLLALWRRYTQPRMASLTHLTLTHGDAYLANFLCPKAGEEGHAYIIDWQSPEVYRGTSDLVNLCATFWTREQRAEGGRERNVLHQYHRTLLAHGISGYAWEALVEDYQLALVDWLFVPVQDRADGSSTSYWWPKMQCLAHAYEDWAVGDLLS